MYVCVYKYTYINMLVCVIPLRMPCFWPLSTRLLNQMWSVHLFSCVSLCVCVCARMCVTRSGPVTPTNRTLVAANQILLPPTFDLCGGAFHRWFRWHSLQFSLLLLLLSFGWFSCLLCLSIFFEVAFFLTSTSLQQLFFIHWFACLFTRRLRKIHFADFCQFASFKSTYVHW